MFTEANPQLDPYCTSGPSPTRLRQPPLEPGRTLHLIGAGKVGCAFLRQLAGANLRLVGVSDSTGTAYAPEGLDPVEIADYKAGGGSLADHPRGSRIDSATATHVVEAEIVVDCTPTSFDAESLERSQRIRARGAHFVTAAKDVVARRAEWLGSDQPPGINALLGGAGRRLVEELSALRSDCLSVSLAGSASTTAIIEAIESGRSFSEALDAARGRGVLEPDPEQDLSGRDAAVKLSVVIGAITGRSMDPACIHVQHFRDIDLDEVRRRPARGTTTRLVGRWNRDGHPTVGYEEVPRGSDLAVPVGRVVYGYDLRDGTRRIHAGEGVGHEETARALWVDLEDSRPSPTIVLKAGDHLTHLPFDFRTEHGGRLPCGHLAYRLLGPAGAPVVVTLGGISADRRVNGEGGWWSAVVAPGRALDPTRLRVLAFDWLGGPGQSSSEDLSVVTTRDQARALAALLDTLGIEHVHAFVGASYGGMVGLAFAADFPSRIQHLVAISAPDRAHPRSTAWRALQRRIVGLGRRGQREKEALVLARGLAMTTYRSAEEFRERFDRPPIKRDDGFRFEIEAYLDHCGRRFAERFDGATFCRLSESIDLHEVEAEHVTTPTTVVAIANDELVPWPQLQALADRLRGPTELVQLDSRYGHDAFLKEPAALDALFRRTLKGIQP